MIWRSPVPEGFPTQSFAEFESRPVGIALWPVRVRGARVLLPDFASVDQASHGVFPRPGSVRQRTRLVVSEREPIRGTKTHRRRHESRPGLHRRLLLRSSDCRSHRWCRRICRIRKRGVPVALARRIVAHCRGWSDPPLPKGDRFDPRQTRFGSEPLSLL